MALLFFWDVHVLPDAAGPVFFASHEEYAGVYLRGAEPLPSALGALERE